MSIQAGLERLQAGDAAGAVSILEQVTLLDPNDGTALQYLGVARVQTGDNAGGVSALQRAATLLPANAGVWFNLGVAFEKTGRTDDARAALQRAVTLNPAHAKAQAALAALPGGSPLPPPPSTPPPPSYQLAGLGGGQVPPPVAPPTSHSQTHVPPPVLGQTGGYYPPPVGGYVPGPAGGVRVRLQAPSPGLRIMRGLGWGAVWGQWWTLLNTFWFIVYGGLSHGASNAIQYIVASMLVFTFMGSLVGLIEGASDSSVSTGSIIGIVAGLLICVGEMLIFGMSPASFINIFFWGFTGRRVGAMIASKIQQPVEG